MPKSCRRQVRRGCRGWSTYLTKRWLVHTIFSSFNASRSVRTLVLFPSPFDLLIQMLGFAQFFVRLSLQFLDMHFADTERQTAYRFMRPASHLTEWS